MSTDESFSAILLNSASETHLSEAIKRIKSPVEECLYPNISETILAVEDFPLPKLPAIVTMCFFNIYKSLP